MLLRKNTIDWIFLMPTSLTTITIGNTTHYTRKKPQTFNNHINTTMTVKQCNLNHSDTLTNRNIDKQTGDNKQYMTIDTWQADIQDIDRQTTDILTGDTLTISELTIDTWWADTLTYRTMYSELFSHCT